MSQQNVDAIRRAFEAARLRGDQEAFVEMCADDVVWDLSRSPFPDGRTYHGLAGVREWLGGLEEAFQGIEWEIEEITDLGQGRVLAIVGMKGSGQFSKIGIDYRFATVSTFRGNKLLRMDRYSDRAEALEAVGLAS